MPQHTPATPSVRSIALLQPLHWLALGWRDMRRAGWTSLLHGLAVALFGATLAAVAYHRFWLLAGALSGFLVVAPVLATGLYALSRALERGEPANAQVVIRTWLRWQSEHHNKWESDYWCLLRFGMLLALAATGWVLTSAALITLLAAAPIETPLDFVRHVVLAPDGRLFALWLALGGVMAAPIFASSVVAMPLLLDRRATLFQAVLTSWKTVLANPLPMALWAALIMGLVLLGFASGMLLLVPLMPLLGHASWHAYRELVDPVTLTARDTGMEGTR